MIDTGAITGKKAEEQEPTPVQQQEQVPEPEKVQEPTPEQPQEASTEEQAEKEPEPEKVQEQAEQEEHEQQEQDTIFNGMSYIELIATAFMLGSLVLLVLTRSGFSIKAFGISILVAFLIECCKPMRK